MRTFTLIGMVLMATAAPADTPLPTYADVTESSGIRFKSESSATSQKYLLETMVGGVAMLDYDGDGNQDLFFVNGAALQDPMPAGAQPDKSEPRFWDRLYKGDGDGSFTDVTEAAGVKGEHYGQGVAVGDYDNDGDPDLYVTSYPRNTLYRNNGDGTFADVSEAAGVAGPGWSTSACFVDYDRDGFLDLFVARYMEWDFDQNRWCGDRAPGRRSYCHPDEFKSIHHLVYRNNGDGTFTDASEASGFTEAPGKGLGIAFNDFDRDGWPDIVVSNDSHPQQLFRNNGDGTFEETGLLAGVSYDEDGQEYGGMGVDFQDYDNDGWPDIFVNALARQHYHLYKNNEGMFEHASSEAGVARITALSSGWGARFVDFDNDGWKDLFVGQGHVMDNIELTQPELRYREPPVMMRNDRGQFHNVSERLGPAFQVPMASRGVAFGDIEDDGFVDFVVNRNNGPAKVIRNEAGNGNHWIALDTVGVKSNRDGIGAQVRLLTENGPEQHGIVSTTGSYMSSSDRRLRFGLGAEKTVKLIEIQWPSGVVQRLENVEADQVLAVREAGRGAAP